MRSAETAEAISPLSGTAGSPLRTGSCRNRLCSSSRDLGRAGPGRVCSTVADTWAGRTLPDARRRRHGTSDGPCSAYVPARRLPGQRHDEEVDRVQPGHAGRVLLPAAQAQVLRRHVREGQADRQAVRVQGPPTARGLQVRLLRRHRRDRVRLRREAPHHASPAIGARAAERSLGQALTDAPQPTGPQERYRS